MYGSVDVRSSAPTTLGIDDKLMASESLLSWGPDELAIDRGMLVSGLEKRVQRARQCRSVPESVILYVIFIIALLVRMPVDKTFEFESRLVGCRLRGSHATTQPYPPPPLEASSIRL